MSVLKAGVCILGLVAGLVLFGCSVWCVSCVERLLCHGYPKRGCGVEFIDTIKLCGELY